MKKDALRITGAMLLATASAFAQDTMFDDLARQNRPARTAAPVVAKLTDGDHDFLLLLKKAIGDIRVDLLDRSADKEGRTVIQPNYAPYETRKDKDGHLFLAGTLFRNEFPGFASKKHPLHRFRFSPEAKRSQRNVMPYLQAAAKHASDPSRGLLGGLDLALDYLERKEITGTEAEWSGLPPQAAKAVRNTQGRLLALQEVAHVLDETRAYQDVPQGMVEKIEEVLQFYQTAFGVSKSGAEIDEARAAAAFRPPSGGMPALISRSAKPFTLKSELRAKLEDMVGRPSTVNGFTTVDIRFSNLLSQAVAELFAPVNVEPGFGFDGRSRSEISAAVMSAYSHLVGLKDVFMFLPALTARAK